jgi:hypothetical protein
MEWRILNTPTSSHLVTEYALLFSPAKTKPKTAGKRRQYMIVKVHRVIQAHTERQWY